jgi:hypothetical protein
MFQAPNARPKDREMFQEPTLLPFINVQLPDQLFRFHWVSREAELYQSGPLSF